MSKEERIRTVSKPAICPVVDTVPGPGTYRHHRIAIPLEAETGTLQHRYSTRSPTLFWLATHGHDVTTPLVTRVPVESRTRAPGGRTNVYLVGDDPAALVDPAAKTADLDAAVAEREVEHVLVTHAHPDHVGAVAEYAEETDATVWARTGYADRFVTAARYEPDRTLHEGTVIPVAGGLPVLDLPGHAPDHVGFVVADGVVSGDLALARGSVVVDDSEGDMRAYLTALRRLRAMAPDRLYPGHGPVVDDPGDRLAWLVAHRLERERRVLSAVRNGATTVEAILAAAYEKDLAGVRDLAARTVRAHLDKLAVEGDVVWDGSHAGPA
jgi:glyoxylase-like metal-dependent hydrolase (beta-lactamase superfamily II)